MLIIAMVAYYDLCSNCNMKAVHVSIEGSLNMKQNKTIHERK